MSDDLKSAAEAYRQTTAARDFAARAAGAEDRIRQQLEIEQSDHEHEWHAWYSLSRAALAGKRFRPDDDVEDDEAGEEIDDSAWVTACVHCGIAKP